MSSTWSEFKDTIYFKVLIIVVIIWVILAIVFGFTDLEISKAVVDRNSLWAKIGEDYGEPPGYALIAIALCVIIGSKKYDIKEQKKFALFLIIIALLVSIVGLIIDSHDALVFGGFIGVGLGLFTFATYKKDWIKYRQIALIIFWLAILNPMLIVRTIKILSGRVRFNHLNPDYSNYTPWYIWTGPSFEDNSFPSGHTAMAWVHLPLLIAVKDRDKKDPVRILVTIFVFSWGIFGGLSRIVIGAHYASDVLFSACMGFIITILLYKKFIFDKERK